MIGASGARKSTKSDRTAVVHELLDVRPVRARGCPDARRSSRTASRRPGTRKDVWRTRPYRSSSTNVAACGKTCGSGQKRIRVPVTLPGRPADRRELGVVDERRERRLGVRPARAVGERTRLAAVEGHPVGLAAPVDLDVQAGGQRVDHARAHAVQAAGRGVGAATELAAGVQLGEDDLDAGQAGLGLDVHRDAAPVVAHLDRAVGVQRPPRCACSARRAPRRPRCRRSPTRSA